METGEPTVRSWGTESRPLVAVAAAPRPVVGCRALASVRVLATVSGAADGRTVTPRQPR
jgi:hypothetical protein